MPLINLTFSTLLHSLIYLKVLNYSFSFSFLIWVPFFFNFVVLHSLIYLKVLNYSFFPLIPYSFFPLIPYSYFLPHSLFIFHYSFCFLFSPLHLLSLFIHYSFRMLNNYFMDTIIITWLNKWEGIDKVRVRVVN